MKTITLLSLLFLSTNAFSSIECETPRLEKKFKIEGEKVVFLKGEDDSKNRDGRIIASVNNVRTRVSYKGFTKTLNFDGLKHTIHINDSSSFSEIEDYIVVRNKLGHQMTYPLSCQNM